MHNNQKQASNDGGEIISIFEIPFNHDLTPSSKDNAQRNVAQVINNPAITNDINFNGDSGLVKKGEIIPAVNQAAATVLANSESDLSWTEVNLSIDSNHNTLKKPVSSCVFV